MKDRKKSSVFLNIVFAVLTANLLFASADTKTIGSRKKTIIDRDSEVEVTLEWLKRPGEFALTIEYFGFLTQEGMANVYLEVNGTTREFIALRKELPNRHQMIRILSFHPMGGTSGKKFLKKLPHDVLVDYLLFKNAPYYSQFGTVNIEMKFFANGRWDGDQNNGDRNFRFEFSNPIKDKTFDHF